MEWMNEGEKIAYFLVEEVVTKYPLPDWLAVRAIDEMDFERFIEAGKEEFGSDMLADSGDVTLPYKRVNGDAQALAFKRDGDAGIDLCSMEEVEIAPQGTVMVHTGIAVAIPAGYEGTIRPRSGISYERGITIANSPATIDSNYRGEILLPLYNQSHDMQIVKKGERVVQMLIKRQPTVNLIETDELPESNRGTDGFGSSGRF